MIAPARHLSSKDLGDFQTPPGLVTMILDALGASGDRYPRCLEPTCGRGNFLRGMLNRPVPPMQVHGIEIQAEHADAARLRIGSPLVRTSIQTADLFLMDLGRDLAWSTTGPLLVVGNPPWVTTAAIGASGGSNGPVRSNVRRLRGIDAMTRGVELRHLRGDLAQAHPRTGPRVADNRPLMQDGGGPERAQVGREPGFAGHRRRDLADQCPSMVPGVGRCLSLPGRGRIWSEGRGSASFPRPDGHTSDILPWGWPSRSGRGR